MIIFAWVLCFIGLLGHIWCLVEAYTEDSTQGMLCICVPFFAFYFAIVKIDPPKKWIIVGLLACGLVGGIIRTVRGEM